MNRTRGAFVAGALVSAVVLGMGCSSDDDGGSQISGGDAGPGGGGGGGLLGDTDGGDFGTRNPTGVEGGPDGSCGLEPFEASRRPVNILIVLDQSGSMLQEPAGFGSDKWSATKSALDTALNAAIDDISFGLDLFPSDGACGAHSGGAVDVDVDVGANSVPAILTALDGTPAGATPTAAALTNALEYFTTGAGSALEGDNYVLLATDGGPNCNASLTCDSTQCTTNIDGVCPAGTANCCASLGADCLDHGGTLDSISDLAMADISTFVVGIPGSEQYSDSLDVFAEAGGVPNPSAPPSYYAVSSSGGTGELAQVLQDITRDLITSCELQLDNTPPNLSDLNVTVDGTQIPRDDADGWELDEDSDPPTVVLLGSTCATVEAEGAENVGVVFGCPSLRIE